MKMIEINHQPGNHCASTGVRNIVNFHGIEMSEAMCFGIGEGLGLWYIDLPNGKPSRMVHVRSADFEKCFFTNFNGHFEWETDGDEITMTIKADGEEETETCTYEVSGDELTFDCDGEETVWTKK